LLSIVEATSLNTTFYIVIFLVKKSTCLISLQETL
jgi:hypothetical protein